MASTVSAMLIVSGVLLGAAVYFRHDAGHSDASTHLHFYMHDDYAGPHPTALLIVLTEGPDHGSKSVGTAQGFTVRVAKRGSVNALSLHLVMEAGEYAGSSLAVQGRVDTDIAVRESVIVGGTGRFRFAQGYALSRSYDYDLAKGGIVEIDVYLH